MYPMDSGEKWTQAFAQKKCVWVYPLPGNELLSPGDNAVCTAPRNVVSVMTAMQYVLCERLGFHDKVCMYLCGPALGVSEAAVP
jgi:hypothetical protein